MGYHVVHGDVAEEQLRALPQDARRACDECLASVTGDALAVDGTVLSGSGEWSVPFGGGGMVYGNVSDRHRRVFVMRVVWVSA